MTNSVQLNTKPANSEQYAGTHRDFAAFLKERCNMTYTKYKRLDAKDQENVQAFYRRCRPYGALKRKAA